MRVFGPNDAANAPRSTDSTYPLRGIRARSALPLNSDDSVAPGAGCRSLVRGVQMNGTGVPYVGPSVRGVMYNDALAADDCPVLLLNR